MTPQPTTWWRFRCGSAAAMCALAIAAAPAGAATVSQISVAGIGQAISYNAAPGELNRLTVSGSTRALAFSDSGADILAGAGCTAPSAHNVSCRVTARTKALSIRTEDGDDSIRLDGDRARTLPSLIDAGAGNDAVLGGPGQDTITGGPGNDVLDGGAGNDVLNGFEAGAAALPPSSDDDVLRGGVGDDTVTGGPGEDRVSGGSGEDNLAGGGGGLFLFGGEAARDVLQGGSGADLLQGDDSSDQISGGSGRDALYYYTTPSGPQNQLPRRPPPLAVSFDGLFNDGQRGQAHSDVASDVETGFSINEGGIRLDHGRYRIFSAAEARGKLSAFVAALPTGVGRKRPAGTLVGSFALSPRARAQQGLDAQLTGGSFGGCGTNASAARKHRSKKRTIRRLLGDVKGLFRVDGRYVELTVHGTRFEMVDRCDATVARVIHGVVSVRDRQTGRTATLRSGQSFVAHR